MTCQAEYPATRRGERVYIRPPRPADEAELTALNRLSAEHYLPWLTAPTTCDEFEAYLQRAQRPDCACFLVCHAETHALMGAVNLSQIFLGNFCNAYMGYYMGAPFARRGYMKEAVALVLDHAFGALGLHRVEANIQPGNQGSRALAQALGFTLEGFSRRYLRILDEWRDHERWAILAEDWAERGTPSAE